MSVWRSKVCGDESALRSPPVDADNGRLYFFKNQRVGYKRWQVFLSHAVL
jgi:hypothetical protein